MTPFIKNICWFAFLFITCLAGSVIIFIFAVGLETGSNIVNDVMHVLIANLWWVIGFLSMINVIIVALFLKNKKG